MRDVQPSSDAFRPGAAGRVALLFLGVASMLFGSSAHAQYGDPWANETLAEAQLEDPWANRYPHLDFGLDVGVLLWNGADREVVRPGGTVAARIGYDYKWWAPMLGLGFRGNGVDLSSLQGAPQGTTRETLTNIFFSLGVRFVTPNRTRVAPFLDGWFDFNWWSLAQTQVVCGVWYCQGTGLYRFAPGFHGRIGLQIRVAPRADLEIGFGAGYSFRGQFFESNRSWIEPSVGFTYSFPYGYQNRTSIPGYSRRARGSLL